MILSWMRNQIAQAPPRAAARRRVIEYLPYTLFAIFVVALAGAASLWPQRLHAQTILPPVPQNLVAQVSNLCLDVPNASLSDGVQLQQWGCHTGNNQLFKFFPVAGKIDVYTIVSEHSGKCLDVSLRSTADGASIQQYACSGGLNQQFRLNLKAADTYELVAQHSNKCVDIAGISTASGAKVQQWSCWGGINQLFKFAPMPVVAYRDYNFSGVSQNFRVGVYRYSAGQLNTVGNDLISSLRVATGYKVQICQHSDGSGICYDFANDVAQVPANINDQTSYLAVEALLQPLPGVAIPQDAKLANFVTDMQAARVLGKALFWDAAVGSDGQQACASCHFHAGADVRTKNQINPGHDGVYQPTRSGNTAAVNYIMRPGDFPFHVLSNPNDRNSTVLFDTNDRLSSQGVFNTRFVGATAGAATDQCDLVFDSRFHVNGISTRKVEPRNTPTTINAVFNLRNFWDGRANETFNGVNPFGSRDSSAGIYQFNGFWWDKVKPNLYFASLASQAVGPPLSDFEMACAGRIWPNVGRRLLSRIPLANQTIASNDSLLAPYRSTTGKGLTQTYSQLVTKAFNGAYRSGSTQVTIGGQNYTINEANFSFFFGVAVQLYEATLVSDDAPLDRYLTGADPKALTDQELRGMKLFQSKGKCTACHSGPQLSNAATPAINDFLQGAIVSYMRLGDGQPALYDEGFYNIGVRPTLEDVGVGGLDPFGNPLSFARQYKTKLGNIFAAFVDPRLTVNPCTFEVNPCSTPPSSARDAVDGAFKVPTLRNVELTGPYFHNGSRSTLEQVVEFYNRGGDSRGTQASNTTGFGVNPSNLDADIQPLGLTAQEQADLAAFLKRPLTDQRVLCDRAPFDHPELRVPNGHVGDNRAVAVGANGAAQDDWLTVPAIGATGMCAADLSGRRLTFEEILNLNVAAQVGSADTLQPQELLLNEPLNPNAQAMPEPLLSEVPVVEVQVDGAAPEVIEEQVTVFEGELPAAESAAQRIFLPLVNK